MNERRRTPWLLLGGALAWASTGSVGAQVPGPVASTPPPEPALTGTGAGIVAPAAPFRVGERLEYDLYVRRHRAGRAILEVESRETMDGIPAYRVTLDVEGGPFFFRIDDRKTSWIALRPFRSLRFRERLREGSGESRRTVELDHGAGVFRERRPASGGRPAIRTGPLPEAAVDELAFFYLLRVLPLEISETLELHRFYEREGNPIVVGVEGRRTVETPAGEFRVLVVRPVVPAVAALAEDARAELLLSDDGRRMLVQVRSRTAVGSVTLRLRSYREGAAPAGPGPVGSGDEDGSRSDR